MYFNIEIDILD